MEIYVEITKKQFNLLNEDLIDIFQGLPYGIRIHNKIGSRAYNFEFDDSILEDVHDWLENNQMSFQLDMDDIIIEDLSEEARDFLRRSRRF
jgi:hypothetical protein